MKRVGLLAAGIVLVLAAGCSQSDTDPNGTYLDAASAPKGSGNAEQAAKAGLSPEAASDMAGTGAAGSAGMTK